MERMSANRARMYLVNLPDSVLGEDDGGRAGEKDGSRLVGSAVGHIAET